MSKVTYYFQNRIDRTYVIPITHSSAYEAARELKTLDGVKPDEWMLVKRTETVFYNRSISQIDSDYKAMMPRNDRKIGTKEVEK